VRRGERIAAAARGRVREASATLNGMDRLCQQLAPERTLERGFSLTRDAVGRAIRHPDQVRPGDVIATRVAGGEFKSRVEER
ncbi:MAG: exodeoxyribonuclease VII large subunit, partial [Thermoanaerobaculia bacterium]